MKFITEAHVELNKQMHAAQRGFGQSGRKHAAEVLAFISWNAVDSLLDYGCGSGTLHEALNDGVTCENLLWCEIREYDPAIEGKTASPEPADLVVCTDVLEHVEPELLGNVLRHLRLLTLKAALLVISTTPGSKKLPDGRDTHLSVHDAAWWRKELLSLNWKILSQQVRRDKQGKPCEVTFWLEVG